MRVVLAVTAAIVLISGCGDVVGGASPPLASPGLSTVSPASPAVSPSGSSAAKDTTVPRDDPSLPRQDRAGRTPSEVLLALIGATDRHDWRAEYALYAKPSATFAIAAKEWAEADESYEDFAVEETRVPDPTHAIVRVTYGAETTPAGGQRYSVVVKPPGEWWSVEKVDGLWRVSWLPRQ